MIDITLFTKYKMIQLTKNQSELFAPTEDNPLFSGDLNEMTHYQSCSSSVHSPTKMADWETVQMNQILAERSILFLLMQCKNYI